MATDWEVSLARNSELQKALLSDWRLCLEDESPPKMASSSGFHLAQY